MNHIKWDGTVNHPSNSNKVYFFLGDQYYRYDWSSMAVDAGYPKLINEFWPGVPNNIDGALNHRTDTRKIYFFKEDVYYRFNRTTGKVDSGYPKNIKGIWGGIRGNISAAVNHPSKNSKVYFFKGTIYYRLNWGRTLQLDSGYPKDIGSIFTDMPDHFESAINHPGLANKVCFFKQNQCYQYDWNTGLDAGYPTPINQYWPGLPALISPAVVAGPLCSSVTETSASIRLWC